MFYNLINSLKTFATRLIEYIPQDIIYYVINQYYTIKSYIEINYTDYNIKEYEYISSEIVTDHTLAKETHIYLKNQLEDLNYGKWYIPTLEFNDNDYADIYYRYNNKPYIMIIPLHSTREISFPPYTNEYILENKSKKILHATLTDGTNITTLIRSYAGPLNNFYQDLGLNIKLNYITEFKNETLKIKTTDLKEYRFLSDDVIKFDDSHLVHPLTL